MEMFQAFILGSVQLPVLSLGVIVASAGLLGYGIGRRNNARRLKALQGEMIREMRRMRRQRDDLEQTVREQDGEIVRNRRKHGSLQPAA
ncbi:MAG: hypothetical protein AAFR52_00045 [Pseudomonadota bacterium]